MKHCFKEAFAVGLVIRAVYTTKAEHNNFWFNLRVKNIINKNTGYTIKLQKNNTYDFIEGILKFFLHNDRSIAVDALFKSAPCELGKCLTA